MLLALLPAARATCVGCVAARSDWKLKWYEKNTNCGTYLGVHKGSLNTCTAGGWYPEMSDGTFDEQAGVRNDSVTYAPRTTAKVTKCDTEGAKGPSSNLGWMLVFCERIKVVGSVR